MLKRYKTHFYLFFLYQTILIICCSVKHQESLLFKISVTSTGLNPAQIDAYTKSIKGLGSVSVTGGAAAAIKQIFTDINSGTKTSTSNLNQFNNTLKGTTGVVKEFGAAGNQANAGFKTMKTRYGSAYNQYK